MIRLAILVVLALTTAACGASPTSLSPAALAPTSSPGASASEQPPPGGAVEAFAADVESAGATVGGLGDFSTDPLGGRGVRLCASGQQVGVYEYATEADQAATAARIDPADPSNLGTAIVE